LDNRHLETADYGPKFRQILHGWLQSDPMVAIPVDRANSREVRLAVRERGVGSGRRDRGAEETCSGGQVLANSERWYKMERRSKGRFVMLSGGCIVFRESYGCQSVWVRFY
jgi:hypothetical protein